MAENWREYPALFNTAANPQLLGHLIRQAGYEAVMYASTRSGKRSLAVFPSQLKNSTSIVRVNDAPSNVKCCELSAANYQDADRLDWQ